MTQNLLNDLKVLLSQDDRLMVDGQVLKNKVIELGLAMDVQLIKLLLSNPAINTHFFVDVDGIKVFDKIKFQQFVSSKEFLPDSYTAFKNKIGLSVSDHYLTDSKEVVLVWPYKDCVLEGGQTKDDVKRDEVFWNETLAPDQIDRLLSPKVLTNFKYYDEAGEHQPKKTDSSDNFIIKGNNLLVLQTLKKAFLNKVKLIYIDPPYNTGNDEFMYNDSFNKSTWLTFMRNRIIAAKPLMSRDGVFIVQLSDHRVAESKMLLDEIFGRDNFINQICVKTRSPSGFKTVNLGVFETAEYLYIYAASDKKLVKYNTQYVKSQYDKNYKFVLVKKGNNKSEWDVLKLEDLVVKELGYDSLQKCKQAIGQSALDAKTADYALRNANSVFRYTVINDDASREMVSIREKSKDDPKTIFQIGEGSDAAYVQAGGQIYFYQNKTREIDGELSPTMLLTNIWTDIAWEGIASEGGVKLKQGKKPERLIKRLLDMYTQENDLVLDFFAGSGTTPAVAHKMGRKYIAIEQMDYIHDLPESRLKSVIDGEQGGISKLVKWKGGGSFVYCELNQANEVFITKIQKAKNNQQLQAIWKEMQETAFLSYKVDPKTINVSGDDFVTMALDNQKHFMIEVLDKNMLYVPLSEIDDVSYGISTDDKKLNAQLLDTL